MKDAPAAPQTAIGIPARIGRRELIVGAAGDLVVAHWTLAQALAARHRTMDAKAEFEKTLAGHERIKRQIPYEEGDNKLVVESRDRLAGQHLATGDYVSRF
jgi:hypothetical protein